tara:strand:- start:906 stop:1274 length:369 start_codon:yes stop_codon:yes gene_type:complete
MVRILKNPNFKATSKSCLKAVQKEFVLNVRIHNENEKKNTPIGEARVGFIVTKSIGKSVARNRVRRRLRAAAQEAIRNHGKANRDYIFIGRKHTLNCSYKTLTYNTIKALKITKSCQEHNSN